VYKYHIRKDWTTDQDTDAWWNNVCVWVIENYGLPGDNYVTELSSDYMIFKFKEKEHAMVTALRWGNDK
jgi:hypothetical protein